MYRILDGKACAAALKERVADAVKRSGREITLAVIIVGGDPASRVYVNNKERDCREVGITSREYALPEETTTEELLSLIGKLNEDPAVHGILCQLPVPKQIDEQAILRAISPQKDVDAFNPENVGKIMTGGYTFAPCTPAGIIELLKFNNIEIAGKRCTVIGRSNIVGKPMALLMLENNATVTVCHSKTKNISEATLGADIIVCAVGKAGFLTADMVTDGAVVVDVGMNRGADGKLCGDVAFDEVAPKTSYITPVPGGVGPMTRAMLLVNTISAAMCN
ncbi:MAG: bifunctional methylenetetrahydrofolate dehydrogenase/methenyltetrahydrofolate cyclohydrolase FolD [Clostridia bacterium]|nr:bifunctional methylenetetrahydrofolate dehydrogenase/methenyltetrahydrofolate cyclohydrolase FolD [Clostridia bacterium]